MIMMMINIGMITASSENENEIKSFIEYYMEIKKKGKREERKGKKDILEKWPDLFKIFNA